MFDAYGFIFFARGGSTVLFWLAVVYAQKKLTLLIFRIIAAAFFELSLICLLF
jgi:hypothetical protein